MAPPKKGSQSGRSGKGKGSPQKPRTAQPNKPTTAGTPPELAPTSGSEKGSTAAEERKLKREEARKARIALARRKQKAKRQRQVLIAGALVLGLLSVIVYGVQKGRIESASALAAAKQAGCGPIQEFKSEGQRHLQPSESFSGYKTSPPTSGPHAQQPAVWGSYNEETPQSTLVHNLEHGGVIVHYKGQSDGKIDEINSLVDSYSDGVVSNPNEKLDKPIVITSWTQMQKCETFSAKFVAQYIKQYCNKGPEKLTTCRK